MYDFLFENDKCKIYVGLHESITHEIRYTVKSKCTIKDQELIHQLKNQIKKKPKSWSSTYYVSNKLYDKHEYPRETNGKYYWKCFVDNEIHHYRNTQLENNNFFENIEHSYLKELDNLIKLNVNVFEYEFNEDSDFKDFKYKRYEFNDDFFHDVLVCSKYTNDPLKIPILIKEIEDFENKYTQLLNVRSMVDEYAYRCWISYSRRNGITIKYDVHVIDLLNVKQDSKESDNYIENLVTGKDKKGEYKKSNEKIK